MLNARRLNDVEACVARATFPSSAKQVPKLGLAARWKMWNSRPRLFHQGPVMVFKAAQAQARAPVPQGKAFFNGLLGVGKPWREFPCPPDRNGEILRPVRCAAGLRMTIGRVFAAPGPQLAEVLPLF